MRVIHKYGLYIILLHAVLGFLIFYNFENRWLWIGVQLAILGSLYLGLRFFYLMDSPYRNLVSSIEDFEKQDLNVSLIPIGDPIIDKLVIKYNEIVHKLSDESLRLDGQGKFLEDLIATAPIGIIITDYDGMVSDMNPSAEHILEMMFSPSHLKEVNEIINRIRLHLSHDDADFHYKNKRLKISRSRIRYKGFIRDCILMEDISNEILHAEKEAYGRVIRMMSHEVNNTVGAVNSILHSVREMITEAEGSEDIISSIDIASSRNMNMGQFISNFASVIRLYPPHFQEVDIYELVIKVSRLYNSEAHHRNIGISLSKDDSLHFVIQIDPVQMEQVLSNIVKNAFESIDHNGEITVHVSDSGKKVMISDNGRGIADETINKLRNVPFYSTKPTGQGVGMMLIKEILSMHDASYELSTHEDGLTRFVVHFRS